MGNLPITLQLPSASVDSVNCRLCSMYLLKKKSVYKWTRAVQTAMFKGQLFKQFSGICIRL